MSGIFLFFLSFNLLSFVFLVETAGIEPASGISAVSASTGLSLLLSWERNFRRAGFFAPQSLSYFFVVGTFNEKAKLYRY